MKAYLEEFFREKIKPYQTAVESLPLETRVRIVEDIEHIFDKNIKARVNKEDLVITTSLDEKLNMIYTLTAQLGWDFGRLLQEKSGLHLRIGEDYAIIYSEVMALFGKDKDKVKAMIFEGLKYEILMDIILRYLGIGPKHISALLN